MPYLRESEIESLSDWLAKPGREDANQFMSSKAVHRAAAVLRCLQEEGISYEVDKDAKEGQLVARLTGTKINVRLTDTRDNEHFIGRVYDNGYSIRYATNKTAANGQGKVAYSNPSAEDTLKLIQFALGRSVSRTDSNQPVGLLNTYKRGQYTMSNAFSRKANQLSLRLLSDLIQRIIIQMSVFMLIIKEVRRHFVFRQMRQPRVIFAMLLSLPVRILCRQLMSIIL